MRTGRRSASAAPADQRLHDAELAAEGAAERLRDDADAIEREPERARELPLGHERALGARRDDEAAVRLEPGGRDLRLDVGLVDPGRPEGSRDDGVARLERGRGVPGAPVDGVEDVRRRAAPRSSASSPRSTPAWIDSRSPPVSSSSAMRASGAPGVIACSTSTTAVERLVVHDDRLDAVLGCRLALRDDDRDRLAREDDLLARERLRGAVVARRRDREVGGGQHRDDAGHRERGVLLDAADARVRLGREDEPRVQQAVDVAVGGEARGAGDLVRRVDPRARDADDALAHRASCARCAARSSARRTTTPARWRRYSAGAKSVAVDLGLPDASSSSASAGRRNGARADPGHGDRSGCRPASTSAAAPASAKPDAGCSTLRTRSRSPAAGTGTTIAVMQLALAERGHERAEEEVGGGDRALAVARADDELARRAPARPRAGPRRDRRARGFRRSCRGSVPGGRRRGARSRRARPAAGARARRRARGRPRSTSAPRRSCRPRSSIPSSPRRADVDEERGPDDAELQHGDEGLAAGERLRVRLRERVERLLERRRTDVVGRCAGITTRRRPGAPPPAARIESTIVW